MNYKLGDTVVCIDAQTIPEHQPTNLKAGTEYTVLGFYSCSNGEFVAVNDGYYNLRPGNCDCGIKHPGPFRTWRFIKLDGLVQEQGEYEGALA